MHRWQAVARPRLYQHTARYGLSWTLQVTTEYSHIKQQVIRTQAGYGTPLCLVMVHGMFALFKPVMRQVRTGFRGNSLYCLCFLNAYD